MERQLTVSVALCSGTGWNGHLWKVKHENRSRTQLSVGGSAVLKENAARQGNLRLNHVDYQPTSKHRENNHDRRGRNGCGGGEVPEKTVAAGTEKPA